MCLQRRHATKVQSPGQEAERDRRNGRSPKYGPRELCLVSDVVIPPKFKIPTFKKYDRMKCPENHLAMYCNKMANHAHDEGLLIHVFYDSLTRAAAQ